MARLRNISETAEDRNTRLFKEVYSQVETEITKKHIAKQQEPIIILLSPVFETTQIPALFLYDKDAKTDLKMLVPKLYSEAEWSLLMQQLIQAGVIEKALDRPTEAVAFAKFLKLLELDSENIINSKFEYFIDFYTQSELNKIVNTIETFEVVNYAKKAMYQNKLLALKNSNNIEALRLLQAEINY